MKVILLEKIGKLGGPGDLVAVKPGYGRNYLVPQGKAAPATAANVAKFEARRAELEAAATEALSAAEVRRENILALGPVTIEAKAGEEGKLFGSVGTRDIAEAISRAGAPVEKSEVRLRDGSLREVGEYEIALHLHSDVDVSVPIHVAAGQ